MILILRNKLLRVIKYNTNPNALSMHGQINKNTMVKEILIIL